MKHIIVGPAGSGRGRLASLLHANGENLAVLSPFIVDLNKSQPRPFLFGSVISKEDADRIPGKVLSIRNNGVDFFTTKQELERSDIWILDPAVVNDAVAMFPDESFVPVSMLIADEDAALKAVSGSAEHSGLDPERAAASTAARWFAEKQKYEKFAEDTSASASAVHTGVYVNPNIAFVRRCNNDHKPETVEDLCRVILSGARIQAHLRTIMEQLCMLGAVKCDEYNRLCAVQNGEERMISCDMMAACLLADAQRSSDSQFAHILSMWLAQPMDLSVPKALIDG